MSRRRDTARQRKTQSIGPRRDGRHDSLEKRSRVPGVCDGGASVLHVRHVCYCARCASIRSSPSARFNLSAAPFPDFSSPQLWYNRLVYPKSAANPLVQIKYTGHLKAVNLAHAKAGIASLNATHFGRGAAARSASLGGPSMAGIQAAGRWNQTSLSASYLIALPREGMRVLAGFPKDGGGFYIPRATVKVPSALAEAVFPGAKAW